MKTSLLPLSLWFLLLCHGSLAQITGLGEGSQHRFGDQNRCRFEKLKALEPTRRVQSEAGVTEHFDENNEQLQCAGVAAHRRTIEPRGLLLPSYSNAPRLVYIVQGRGVTGNIIPGCPETYQSIEQQREPPREEEEGQGQRSRDRHQKIHNFRQGDIIALPAGVAHWCYNDGETPVIAVTVLDTSSNANQLDRSHRHFQLAGSQQRGQQQQFEQEQARGKSSNIFSGFDLELLAEALGVNREVARKLQSKEQDQRGEIVRVENGLQLVRPPRREERQEEQQRGMNGLDQAFCYTRFRENIGDPTRADVYNPRGGRLTTLNSKKLPILDYIQLSATRGVLYKNAFLAPHWSINAHSLAYVTGGRARVQIVGNNGRSVFDGEVRQGQLVFVPQNFAVMTQARDEGFEWVSFKTNDNAMGTQVVGRGSLFPGLPEDVIVNSYPGLSREEARSLKFSRGEHVAIFPPRSQGRAEYV